MAALAALELVAALAAQARPVDAWTATAGTALCAGLGLTLWTLTRKPLLPAWLVGLWIAFGAVRAVEVVVGASPGWLLDQSIAGARATVSSQSILREVSFQAGEAPAWLINDLRLTTDPQRAHLPLGMTLRAYVHGQGTLTVASSAPVTVKLGSQTLFDSGPPPGSPPGTVMTPQGPKSLADIKTELQAAGYSGPFDDASLTMTYIRTALSGGWQLGIDAAQEQLLEIDVTPQDVSTAALQLRLAAVTAYSAPATGTLQAVRGVLAGLQWPLGIAALVFGLGNLALLARRAVEPRPPLWRVRLAAGALLSALYAAPRIGDWADGFRRLTVLSGGDDWLTYESFARDIRGGSWLMLQGNPLGHAQAFYYQALYPYVLAIEHFALGENVHAIELAQLGLIAVALTVVVFALPQDGPALIAFLVVLASGVAAEWFTLAGYLLSENLLLLMVALLLLAVSQLETRPTRRQLWAVGSLLGLAILARSTAWMAAPFVLWIVCRVRGETRRNLRLTLTPLLALVLLIPIRNVIAAHDWSPIPTSGSINVFQGVVPDGRQVTTEPWLSLRQKYDPNLVASAEAIVNAPKDVALKMLRKAGYVLGLPRLLPSGDQPLVFFPVFVLWLLAPAAVLSAGHSRLAWVALVLAVSHAVTLVLIFPNNYYYRLLLPAMLPLAVWDALAIARLLRRASWPALPSVRVT
ncbi:MAG: hypothetical protein JO247_08355 [Chloroflexi bacterium]|nr:hypothetical protein [Chloroflexota bacterium]